MTEAPIVSIQCLVYNHEPFLRQCLDGFVMQQTTFPFEAIVHDDASTDGSAAIIREYAEKYPDIIKPIYETENQYHKHDGSLARVINAAIHPQSKYIAYCEGDDYWTDPNKLQMQVDIMENNPEIGIVHTAVDKYDQKHQRISIRNFGNPMNSFDVEMHHNECLTLTVCFRKELYLSYRRFYAENNLIERGWKMGDYPMWLYACYYSKPYYIPKSTGVYRELEHSASHNPDINKQIEFELSAFDIRMFFAEHFHREDLINDIKRKMVSQLQWILLPSDQKVDIDIMQVYKKYGLPITPKLMIKHVMLSNRLLRKFFLVVLDKYVRIKPFIRGIRNRIKN